MDLYRTLLQPALFHLPAERAHALSLRLLASGADRLLPRRAPVGGAVEAFKLRFPNPLGLAAGMDKDAVALPAWQRLGFGFVEAGTVTPRPQAGNPRPRLFRLPADRALLNRMGFNNAGMDAMATRLERRPPGLVVGVNIGKNKTTPNAEAAADYEACLRRLHPLADYFVINISSPNTPGLRELFAEAPLRELLARLQTLNHAFPAPKPLLLKLSPDLDAEELARTLAVAREAGLSGLIATNTSLSRADLHTPPARLEAIGAGGLSGAPLKPRAHNIIRQAAESGLPVIGVGGILSPGDAREHLAAGAQLLQVYTGLVYEGPGLVRRILAELASPNPQLPLQPAPST